MNLSGLFLPYHLTFSPSLSRERADHAGLVNYRTYNSLLNH